MTQRSHKHHYVPEWYQKRFLRDGRTAFKILDLRPDLYRHPKTGALVGRSKEVFEKGPSAWFFEKDLYTVRAFGVENDDIERHLFGRIDREGQHGLEALVANDWDKLHSFYDRFFEFVDALRLRTPKGLHFIQQVVHAHTQHELMLHMQKMRKMHCVMWAEGAREIFTAEHSGVKFLLTDHPVTFYNRHVFPSDPAIPFPLDPPQQWQATQTLFPLDHSRLAVFTHNEWGRAPIAKNARKPRTNARYFDNPLIRYDDWERSRQLEDAQVQAVNFILKTRAHRYVASTNESDLYPERSLKNRMWPRIAPFLMPKDFTVAPQVGYMVVGMKDGSYYFQDEFGRRPQSKGEYEAEIERAKRMKQDMERLLRDHAEKSRANRGGEDS